MEKRLVTEAERLLNSRHQNKRRTQVIRGLALLVVLATISALMLPAITMSNEVECGMEEHIHSENCYAVQQVAPQPMLICTEGQFGEMLLHVHDSFCYDSQGNLICTLQEMEAHTHGPECYQERRALICTETSDPGHQHEASCYSYVKVENAAISMDMMAPTATNEYVCGMQEGEGAHQHTDNCYPKERTQRLICAEQESDEDVTDEEGNVLIPAHRHNSGCYEVQETPVFERFICTQEESDDEYDSDGSLIRQGHRHDGGCWLRGDELCYQEGCHQHESSGHQHTGACVQAAPQESIRVDGQGEQWEQTLVCQEPEREPGHIHTDACYEITQMLACQKAELEAHTHGASCEDENGALICGKTEISAHQHTDACFTVPEGGSEEAEVLICGMDEHTHTDLCYVKTQPETEKFYCGMEEHVHTTECEFPSGALKCTIPEHYHIDTCLAPPVEESEEPGESPGPEESQLPEDIVEVKDAEFVYHENPAFVVTFKVNGFARVAGDQPEQLPQDGGPVFSGEELTEIIDQAAPLAAMPRMMSMMALVDDMPSSGPDLESTFTPATTTDETDSTTAPGSVSEPEGTAVENSSHPILPAFSEPVPEISFAPVFSAVPEENVEPIFSMPVESAEPSQDVPEASVEFYVEELGEDDPALQSIVGTAGEFQDMENILFLQGLQVKASRNGVDMDLSQCTMSLEIQPTAEFIAALEAQANVMAIDDWADGDSVDGSELETVPMLSVVGGDGEVLDAVELSGEVAALSIAEMSADAPVAFSATNSANPSFTVQYYAEIEQVKRGDAGQLEIIDTSNGGTNAGGKLPENRAAQTTQRLNLVAGKVETERKTVEIYTQKTFTYAQAPNLKYFNLFETFDAQRNENYELKEIWVYNGSGDPEMDNDKENWKVYTYDKEKGTPRFTNRKVIAEAEGNADKYIWIENGAVIRLVCEQTTKSVNYPANFYDYDISNGEVRTDTSGNKIMKTYQAGINESLTKDALGQYAFGGANAGTYFGGSTWEGNLLNAGNHSKVYKGCTFGLVSGMKDDGKGHRDVVFSDGVTGPTGGVFGGIDGIDDKGKKVFTNYSLNFNRQGDTFTLSSVEGTGTDNLEYFNNPAYDKDDPDTIHTNIWTNNFWPMDSAGTWGDKGHDMKFGSYYDYANKIKRYEPGGMWNSLPRSDDGQDHNAYFGMDFEVQFDLVEEYVGPLEYYFFGDDDMWVFLTKPDKTVVKVCDIGGVHSAVGEYVNLWDYIEKGSKGRYKLTFFYTERGASGSTCWMQFTLPSVSMGTTAQTTDGLTVKKSTTGALPADIDQDTEFEFTIKLWRKENGAQVPLLDDYNYVRVKADGTNYPPITLETTGTDIIHTGQTFQLKAGERIEIAHLPIGTYYEIVETPTDGCTPSYQINTGEIQYGKMKEPVMLNGATTLQVVNSFYELPETGGSGIWYTMACVPLAALFCLMYKKKSQREGDGG